MDQQHLSPINLNELINALQDNRRLVLDKMEDLDKKFDGIPAQLEATRKENRESNERLRLEMQSYFVAKTEYMPDQRYILGKIAEYDRIVSDSRQQTPEWVRLQEDIKTIKKRQDDDEKKNDNKLAHWGALIAILLGLASFAVTLLQHFSFHP